MSALLQANTAADSVTCLLAHFVGSFVLFISTLPQHIDQATPTLSLSLALYLLVCLSVRQSDRQSVGRSVSQCLRLRALACLCACCLAYASVYLCVDINNQMSLLSIKNNGSDKQQVTHNRQQERSTTSDDSVNKQANDRVLVNQCAAAVSLVLTAIKQHRIHNVQLAGYTAGLFALDAAHKLHHFVSSSSSINTAINAPSKKTSRC
jgi:hypothetical protein